MSKVNPGVNPAFEEDDSTDENVVESKLLVRDACERCVLSHGALAERRL